MEEAKSNVVISPTFWHKDLSSVESRHDWLTHFSALVEETNVCLFRKDKGKKKKANERLQVSYTTVITKSHCFKLQ